MRGSDTFTESLFSIKRLDDFVPASHPLRAIRTMVNEALTNLEDLFAGMYEDAAKGGRPSIAPQKLLRAMLLQVLFSVRSERLLMEQVQYNLLFRWFIGLSMEDSVWVPTVFSKNRQRLIEHDAVVAFFNEVLAQAERKNWLSKEHFSVDGTLIQAWAGHKSFVRKDRNSDDDSGGGNFAGQTRTNETHESSTDPDSRLYRKGKTASELRFMGHTLMENRNGLVINARVTQADGYAEREAAKAMGHFSKPLSHLTPESVTIQAMITPRIKPSAFWRRQVSSDLFVQDRRQEKMGSFIANLAAMDELVDFAAVAAQVDSACPRPDRSKGGRPPYPTEIMVRLVFIQSLYNLSDEECEYQVLDRMSFQHFCRLAGELHIPDARTLWRFKQQLAQGGLGGRAIFEAVSQQLQAHGYLPRGGQIVDASIVQAPVMHTRSEEREALNEGQAPEGWSSKKLRHTDRDARWTKKHGKSYYGYKVHANSDARYKLIRKIKVTPANVDDGQTLKDVLDPCNTGKRVLADRGYDSQANRDLLREQQLRDGIGRRARPGQQKRQRLDGRNTAINRIRARGEHVFAGLQQLGGKVVRAMTLARNELAITLQCVAYNVKRLVWLAAHEPAH